jgi:hypothetical protein
VRARSIRYGLLVFVAACAGLTAPWAGAQEINQDDVELDRAAAAPRSGQRALDAAAEAALFVPLEPARRVSYAQVLEHPDDIELNFRWAQTQVEDGDLTGAAATLERILLLQPELPRVRMLYGAVLFRLGNLSEADREFARLERDGRPSDHASIAEYRKRIRRASSPTHTTASLTAGTQHDTNRNTAPDSGNVLIGDIPFSLTSTNDKNGDGGWYSLLDLHLERDLGYQEDRKLIAGLSYYHSQQDDLDSYDVQAWNGELGLRLRQSEGSIQPRLFASIVDLSREKYLRAFGLELAATHTLSKTATLWGHVRLSHEDFDDIPEVPTASDRRGLRGEARLGSSFALAPRRRLDVDAAFVNKSADEDFQGYVGPELGASHLWIQRCGTFLIAELRATSEHYKHSQNLISGSSRRDLRTRGRLSFGVPLALLLGEDSAVADAVLSLTTELVVVDSNLTNFEYRNRRVGVSLSKRLEF